MYADFLFTTADDESSPTIKSTHFDDHIHLKISHPSTGNIYFILSIDEARDLSDQLKIALMDRDYAHGKIPQ